MGGAYRDDIITFLENTQNKSLLYMAELEELVKRFYAKYAKSAPDDTESQTGQITEKKKTLPLNGKDEEYDENDYESILNNIRQDMKTKHYEISKHDPQQKARKAIWRS